MKVWKMSCNVRDFENLVLVNYDDLQKMEDQFDGETYKGQWTPLLMKTNKKGNASDFPLFIWRAGVPIFTDKALNVLRKFIDSGYEVLPLIHNRK
ncbi:hypothetical protein ASG89_33545 [Paenibacillus sp. Soil766]|uniref:hypothetical protein n=1 Tax=Paenibacillus sp. Soil766 TaxID=1736404 RepID=UPI0007100675|nr:hypothetical protein [Paenibacillus sp. Soil766]KRE92177.1 hypothetical protein ASG89_33545 [Paenibacillus sp. Soil766]